MGKKRKKSAKKKFVPVTAVVANSAVRSRVPAYLEFAGIFLLVCLTIFFVATSWRKWPDPLIDFGAELYVPWQLNHGALLFREVYAHGILSQYFNAALFAIFGPGLMVLVMANLIVFAGILSVFYLLCRRAWGAGAAFIACAIFISVFGFSQLVGISNYNYATPYAHETTHGLFVSLLLVWVLVAWVDEVTVLRSFLAGFLLGLTAVLKPEFMLAGFSIVVIAFALRWRQHRFPRIIDFAIVVLGAALPTLAFLTYFAQFLPLREAWLSASHVWWELVVVTHLQIGGVQAGFTGLKKPSTNFAGHLFATTMAILIISGISAIVWLSDRIRKIPFLAAIGVALGAALVWLSCSQINWREAGRSLLGLTSLYIIVRLVLAFRRRSVEQLTTAEISRLLLGLLATLLMARMALNGRIYQYGFYQAALAGSFLPAFIVGEIPEWLKLKQHGRILLIAGILALLGPGVVILARQSQMILRLKTVAIGQGVDRFYAFPRKVEPTGEIVARLCDQLDKKDTDQTLIVVPEGIMLNYLTRLRSPIPQSFFLSTDETLMTQLAAHPPNLVAIISRNLREYGIERYGQDPNFGGRLLTWLDQHYEQVARVGGDPLNSRQRGAVILQRSTR